MFSMNTTAPMLTVVKTVLNDESAICLDAFDKKTIDYAIDSGLGPIAFYCARNHPSRSESPYYSELLSSELTSQFLIGGYLDAIEEIFQFNPSLAKEVVLLKGISMCMQYYPESHMRTMGDIDLLVDIALQSELERICLKLGYQQKSQESPEFYKTHHHSMPLYHPDKKIWIEIHSALFSDPATVANDKLFSADHVKQQTVVINFRGIETRILNNEMQLVYICSHWAEEPNWIKSLIQILDMLFIINNSKENIKWNKIHAWLDNSSTAAHLYVVLSLLKKYRLIDISVDDLNLFSKKQHSVNLLNRYILHNIVIYYVFQGRLFGKILSVNNINIIWSTLLHGKHSPVIKLFVDLPWNLLFPPENGRRFNLLFQLRRIRSMFYKASGE